AFYRVQRHSEAVPTTETSVKLIEGSLAIFFFCAIIIFLHNLSALVFYTTYFGIMILSFTNFRIPQRKTLMELPTSQKTASIFFNPTIQRINSTYKNKIPLFLIVFFYKTGFI
ncbi:MAG: hypothetical protein ACFFDT_39235, partial [Candidatus Hodarchaeota archaeon]